MLVKLDAERQAPQHPNLFHLARQLKAGQGLTVCCSVVEGDYSEKKKLIDHTRDVRPTIRFALTVLYKCYHVYDITKTLT